MVIFLRIPLSIVLLCDKVLRLDLILVELLADEDYVRFLESCCTVNKVRGQTGFFDLIAVTAGFGTADGECLFVLRSVEGQGKGIVRVDEFLCVALRADIAGGNIFAPENAETAPACGHGVVSGLIAGSDQHPLGTDLCKGIKGETLDINFFECHGKNSFHWWGQKLVCTEISVKRSMHRCRIFCCSYYKRHRTKMQMEFSAREIPSHEKTAEYRQIKTLRSCMNLNKKSDKRKLGLEEKECRCYIFDKKDLSGSLILRMWETGDGRTYQRKCLEEIFMRGVETRIQEIRHRIFREVARMAYHTEWPVDKRIEELPYKIIPGEVGNFRNDVFLERAIVSERLRLAMGLPYRGAADPAPVSTGIEEADKPETYYTPPLINVIKFACNACPEKRVYVTDGCQGCLAHPCVEVCPKDAVTIDRTNGRSKIDPDKCIRCGQCANVCAYHAIIIQERPCAAACGMDAIHSDMNGKADIDYNKCVSCGQCLVNCPFGAIADKSQIFQVIRAIQTGERVYAAVAPAFVGQFGPKVTPGKLRAAMKALGFADVFEVAIGADLCAVQEAEDFVKEVPEQLPFMATSCCPAWSVMAKKLFPDYSNCISMALTPMTLTARLIKKKHEKGKVVFIGPCAAKKLEAMRTSVRSDVDFVLTFEEMAGIFDARHVDIENIEEDEGGVNAASKDGRNFAVAGGVAKSVVDVIAQMYPEKEIKVANAEGLKECKKLLQLAKAGKYNGYLLEGMACPGGCVAGAGTMQPVKKSQVAVNLYAGKAGHVTSDKTEYVSELDKLVD